jgi:hypothetical protein
LSDRIVDIAHARRRFGYRRIHDLIRPEFPGVNHKRIYRLYKDTNQPMLSYAPPLIDRSFLKVDIDLLL